MTGAKKITKTTAKVLEAVEKACGTTNEWMLAAELPWTLSTVQRHLRLLIDLGLVQGGTCQVTGHAQLITTPQASAGLKAGLTIQELL